jgi:hypothetical protein
VQVKKKKKKGFFALQNVLRESIESVIRQMGTAVQKKKNYGSADSNRNQEEGRDCRMQDAATVTKSIKSTFGVSDPMGRNLEIVITAGG